MNRIILTAAALAGALCIGAGITQAQTFKPVINAPAVADRMANAKLLASPLLPKAQIATAAQQTLSIGTPPPVADGAMLDVLHLIAGYANLSLRSADVVQNKTMGTMAQMSTVPNSGWMIGMVSPGKAHAVDCGVVQLSGPSLLPVSFKVTTLGMEGEKIVGEGTAPITSNRALAIVPAYPAGTQVNISFSIPKNGAASSAYWMNGCKLYQLG